MKLVNYTLKILSLYFLFYKTVSTARDSSDLKKDGALLNGHINISNQHSNQRRSVHKFNRIPVKLPTTEHSINKPKSRPSFVIKKVKSRKNAINQNNNYRNKAVRAGVKKTPKPKNTKQKRPPKASPTTLQNICERHNETSFCKDCKTLVLCNIPENGKTVAINCAQQTDNRAPFCDKNIKQCVVNNTCADFRRTQKLICLDQGLQPDPLDCSRYIQCEKLANGQFEEHHMKCPESSPVFDSQTQTCGVFPCQNLLKYCENNEIVVVRYNPLPQIYVKCPAKNYKDVYVCQKNHTFNHEIDSCEPKCDTEGLIPTSYDCHFFYVCKKGAVGYSMTLTKCPRGFGFDINDYKCKKHAYTCGSIDINGFLHDVDSSITGSWI